MALSHFRARHFNAAHFIALGGAVSDSRSQQGAGRSAWRRIVPVSEIIERLEQEEKQRKQQLAVVFKQADNRRKAAEATDRDKLLSELVEQAQRMRSLRQLSGRNQARLRKLQAQIDFIEQEQDADDTALFLLLLALWPDLLAELEITQSDEDAALLLTMFM